MFITSSEGGPELDPLLGCKFVRVRRVVVTFVGSVFLNAVVRKTRQAFLFSSYDKLCNHCTIFRLLSGSR
jgi:hypothetical protein